MKGKYSEEDKKRCIPVIQQIIELSNISRMEGVLALEERISLYDADPLLQLAISLVVDGIDPLLVKGILENILITEAYEGYDLLKASMIIEGILSIQAGENPRIIEIKLASFIGLDYTVKLVTTSEEDMQNIMNIFMDEVKSKSTPVESRTFDLIIGKLSNREIQMILRETSLPMLLNALKTCNYETVEKLISNLSKRMAMFIIDEMKVLQINNDESIKSQDEILSIYKKLVNAGEIIER